MHLPSGKTASLVSPEPKILIHQADDERCRGSFHKETGMTFWNDGDKRCRPNPVRTETELEDYVYDQMAELQLER